jgi:cytoskeletal protein RodZ
MKSPGMENHSQESFGDFLKTQREARNVSREELSRATRIGLPFLIALEENDFDFFPKDEFIPGFLRIYCRHLHLDEGEVLRRYFLQQQQDRMARSFQQLPLFMDPKRPAPPVSLPQRADRQKRNRIPLMLAIILISLGFSAYLHSLLAPGQGPLADLSMEFILRRISNLWSSHSSPGAPSIMEKQESSPGKPSAPDSSSFIPPTPGSPSVESIAPLEGDSPEEKAPSAKSFKVIGNRDSKRYHLPGMKYYNKVAPYHRVEFDSEEEAIRAGYHKAPR